ncbi:MAG: ABC transporter ATP-binding protein [Verrucomicrobia bacterium]|nr:ABC transporter ATP-binding protein [Verrucomicrobiota bacterium]
MSSKKKSAEFSWSIYRRLLSFTRPYVTRLVLGIVCGVLYGATAFGLIIIIYWAVGNLSGEAMGEGVTQFLEKIHLDQMFASSHKIELTSEMGLRKLVITALALPLIALLQGVVFFVGKYCVEWVGTRVVMDVRSKLFSHIHDLPMQFFGRSRVGELISRITNDTAIVRELVANVIGDLIREPFTLVGCVFAMVVIDWKLSFISLILFPICIIPVAILGKKIRKASRHGQEKLGDLLSVVQESFGGAVVVKAFQMEQAEKDRFDGFNNQVFRRLMQQARASSLNEPIMVFLASLAMSGVVIYAFLNDLSSATLIAFAVAMGQMYKPFKKLSNIQIRIQKAAPGAERIFEILDLEIGVRDSETAVAFDGPIQTIDFENVSFAYDDTDVLKNIDLNVRAGQCVAFVGSSGAGKTTIVNLIPRFYDVTGGRVRLNGKDLRDYTIASLRRQIGIVTQETILFNQSVAANIAYGSPDATREEVEAAARRANAHEFISAMDEGYETVIGERGTKLSGGQAQRLAIARALLKNPPILILDEATSALDTESERQVQGALDELMKERTVFVIAHRLSTIIHADNIVVLDQGRVAEQGSHAELLALGGKYKYFHGIQFSDKKES